MPKTTGMIDVSGKPVTERVARAEGSVFLGKKAFDLLLSKQCPKGDPFETARIAAINAAKQTPCLIPLCHTPPIDVVNVDFSVDADEKTAKVEVRVKSNAKTGVEMEALTATAVACLTLYDMLKTVGKGMIIWEIRLLEKTGGQSGNYRRSR